MLIPNVWFGTHKFFIFFFFFFNCHMWCGQYVEIHLKKSFWFMIVDKNFFAHLFLLWSHITILPSAKLKNPYNINMLLSLTCRVVPPLFGIHDTMEQLSYLHEIQIRLYTTLFVPNLDTKIIHNIHTWSHPCRLVKPRVEDIRGCVTL